MTSLTAGCGPKPTEPRPGAPTVAAEQLRKWLLAGATSTKAVCRYCGTGCGVIVWARDNRVVATEGDALAPVNKGLNCIKGYHLSQILYGQDRLTKPLIRKNGKLTQASWEAALDLVAAKIKEALADGGPNQVGIVGSGQWTIFEGYAAAKFMKAGLKSLKNHRSRQTNRLRALVSVPKADALSRFVGGVPAVWRRARQGSGVL